MSPGPDFLVFPERDDAWLDFVSRRFEDALARALDLVGRMKDGSTRASAEVIDLWNGVELALRDGESLVAFLAEVHPQRSVRTLAEEGYLRVQSYTNSLKQDASLYGILLAAYKGLGGGMASSLDTEGTEAPEVRLLRLTLRDFRRAGVELDEATRERLSSLVDRETKLGQDFSRVIREDVRSIHVAPSRLGSLPPDYVAEHAPGPDGLVTITTDYPDFVPFSQFCDDADARLELTSAFLNRGWPENEATLRELLAARNERARMLGYAGWPDYAAEDKMLSTGKGVADFIDRVATLARAGGERDRAELLERLRRDRPHATGMNSADRGYYSELLRREIYDVDAQLVRRYFDFEAVRAGLLDVTGRLFGLRYEPVASTTWHEDVVTYDVYRLAGIAGVANELVGRIHLDLFPRDGKFKHAAQFPLVVGVNASGNTMARSLPEGALACNFSRGLMEHSDVVTLFHEFGHLIHDVLGGKQEFARFSGVATEWDFVEAPSQMLEEWAWSSDVLRLFALNEDGQPIPVELVRRLNAARDFGKSAGVCTQMFYAAVSYYLHALDTVDIATTVRELKARYDVFDDIANTHFHTSFGHLEGYSSVYYTYMWSLVIAKDLFSAFDPINLFDTAVSYKYRDEILARGGVRDAADLVADFLGRPYDFSAFADWLSDDSTPISS
ncbi:MAG TPA: M3 family metallopeptidase [Acidimicrobiales bacterium]